MFISYSPRSLSAPCRAPSCIPQTQPPGNMGPMGSLGYIGNSGPEGEPGEDFEYGKLVQPDIKDYKRFLSAVGLNWDASNVDPPNLLIDKDIVLVD